MARQKVVVDPITRIEGHLRIEVQAEDGRIADAWASSTQFRGIEIRHAASHECNPFVARDKPLHKRVRQQIHIFF